MEQILPYITPLSLIIGIAIIVPMSRKTLRQLLRKAKF